MNKILLGAAFALGLLVGTSSMSIAAPGDGLSPNASMQGNGRTGGMHSFNRRQGRMGMMQSRRQRMMQRQMMRRR